MIIGVNAVVNKSMAIDNHLAFKAKETLGWLTIKS
jgi:hypothetical protein